MAVFGSNPVSERVIGLAAVVTQYRFVHGDF